MTERPILFSGPMVRAILSGAKTVTRRPVVPMAGRQRQWLTPALLTQSPRLTMCRLSEADGGDLGAQMEHPKGGPLGWVRSPLGAPGDRLWVRESWCPGDYWTSGVVHDPPEDIRYAADNSAIGYATGKLLPIDTTHWSDPKRWRPSIHMPRWASRLALDVVSVGVERLQDISPDDALREGVRPTAERSARGEFARLWSEVYGAGAWDANPWVWRVEFARVEGGR